MASLGCLQLGRGLSRSKTYRLLALILLTVLSLVVVYGLHPNVRTLWTYTTAIHQSFANTTSQSWQWKRPIFNFGSKDANTSSSAAIYEPSRSDGFELPEKGDSELPSEYSIIDGVKVSPPAPPADTDNYVAICKLQMHPKRPSYCLFPGLSNPLTRRNYRPPRQR